MKRMFLSMLAAVTLFASCSQEEVVSQQQATGEESLVCFTLITPELGSRAAATEFNGDGKLATDLYYAVYDETIGEIVEPISVKGTEPVEIEVGTPETIQLPLLNGHKYSLIFWAENEGCPYTVNWDEKAITLDNNGTGLKNNQEVYDAFYAYYPTFTVTGHKTENIELKRPFAQLNIATSEGDLERVVKYYYGDDATKAIASTQIVVTTPTAMDLTTGNAYDEQELIYTMETYGELKPETGLFPATVDPTIDGVYKAISLNYLLVSAEKQLVDIKMSCNSGVELDKEFKNVPVQRNYRTNIYGNLYTSSTEWKVEIKPEFDGSYTPADQLAAVFEEGGEVTLYTDVKLTGLLTLKEGKEVTINLNGNTITRQVQTDSNGNTSCYVIYNNGGTLNIKGEGTIETGFAYYSVPVWTAAGTTNIYGGEYYNAGDGCDLIYASGTGQINIYGGYFKAADKTGSEPGTQNTNTALNILDADRSTAKINVYGGTFYKFDPANNKSEGDNTNFVADGYKSVKDPNANIWYVVKDEVEVATTADALSTALSSTTSNEVAMVKDVEITSTVTMVAGATLEGQGNTVTMTKNNTQTIFAPSEGGTIKNLNIKGYNERNEKNKVIRGILETDIAGDLTLENVNISGVAYPINIQASKGFVATHSLTATGSTFTGWTSYTGLTSASFTDCTFAVGTYFDSTVAGQETWNGCIKPYVTSTFTGCEFGEGFVLDLSALKTNATLTFESCTVNGVALTALSQLGVNATDTRVTIK